MAEEEKNFIFQTVIICSNMPDAIRVPLRLQPGPQRAQTGAVLVLLILVDAPLPDVTAFQVCSVKSTNSDKRIPAYIDTGYSNSQMIVTTLSAEICLPYRETD